MFKSFNYIVCYAGLIVGTYVCKHSAINHAKRLLRTSSAPVRVCVLKFSEPSVAFFDYLSIKDVESDDGLPF